MSFSLADEQKAGQLRDRHQQLGKLGSTRSGSNNKKNTNSSKLFSSQGKASHEYPTEFYCPISHCLMLEPVMDREGNTYERTSIEQWLSKHNTSPITRNSLNANHLVVNRALVGLMELELNRRGDQPELEKRKAWQKQKERNEKERNEKERREQERQQQLQQQRQQQHHNNNYIELERRRVLQEQRDSRRRIASEQAAEETFQSSEKLESDIIARVEAAVNKRTLHCDLGVYYGQMVIDGWLWEGGNPDGYGTWTNPDGNKYVGHSKNSKPDGNGTWTWANGDKYVGEWKNNKMHGHGTYTWADGTIKHSGEWVNDQPKK